MAATQDYTKMMKDFMGTMPGFDMSAMQTAYKSYATFGEKMSKVALEAADKSTEISTKWMKDTFSKVGDMTTVKEDPSDYGKAMTDFATSEAEMTAETMAAFAEVAKKAQMESVELMMAAGKDMSEDMTSAAKKATADVGAATKKAATATK